MSGIIKWGIIGPGIIANEFAFDFQFVKNAKLEAVASSSSERAEAFAHKFSIPKVYTSYDDLYNDPEIDIIYIATPHTFHFEQSKKALLSGKAVLCEKPMTVTLQETLDLLTLAQEQKKFLMEGMWTYFLPAIQKAYQWAATGRIGKVIQVKSDFGYKVPYNEKGRMYNPDLAGGSLLDMGVYNIAMAWLFLQKTPKDIYVNTHFAPTGVDNFVQSFFDYGNEQSATLTSAFKCKLHNTCFIIGEEGYIEIPDFWRAKTCKLYENEDVVADYHEERKGFGFNYEIESVSNDLIQGNLTSSIHSLENTLKLQEHMTLVREKMKQYQT